MKKLVYVILLGLAIMQWSCDKTYHVNINGSDTTGDGSSVKPWRTLNYALSKVQDSKGYIIKLSAGIFVEKSFLAVPDGINIEGEGMGLTVIKPDSSLYFKSSEWRFDKFLISLSDSGGNQSLRNFTIDGDSKQLYGGVIVKGRSNVLIQSVRVENCYFTGMWLWGVKDSRVTDVQLKDNAWGGPSGASASIILSESERLEVDHLHVDESFGQALDGVNGKMYSLKLHDNRFSVNPKGSWKTTSGANAPNICVEFFNAELRDVEIYNNYFDNSLSVVMNPLVSGIPNDTKTIRVYNNTFDLITRAQGNGYGLELTVDNAEVDHNYFWGGSTGIVNWESKKHPARQSWEIHHNVFYGLVSQYPSAVITFYQNGITGAHIYNNTVELTGTSTVSFIEANHGGQVKDLKVENNLIIDSNISYSWYRNKFISLNESTIKNGTVRNNFLEKIPLDTIRGIQYSGNFTGHSKIQKAGNRPKPYYSLSRESPLINAGLSIDASSRSSAPDIGAFDYEQ